jgi:hypothetical protein
MGHHARRRSVRVAKANLGDEPREVEVRVHASRARLEDGSWGFSERRPRWPLPIHQLLVANGVTIFFQGHDHLFARQTLDGVVYQSLPNPADDSYTAFNETTYQSGDTFPNAGYVKVTVSPSSVTVEYIRMFLPEDEVPPNRVSGMVQFSYTIPAPQ